MTDWRSVIGGVISEQNEAVALIDGPETFNSMYAALTACIQEKDASKARYIYLLGWWLDLDLPLCWRWNSEMPPEVSAVFPHKYEPVQGTTVGELLKQAAAAGIQVRAMLWDQKAPDPRKNSAEVDYINDLPHAAAILDNNTPSSVGGTGVNGSHHQKLLVVRNGDDSLVAFCGGVDLNWDRVKVVNSKSPMHDVHCRIVGPAANSLLGVFVQRWRGHPLHTKLDLEKGPLLAYRLDSTPSSPGRQTAPSAVQAVRVIRTFNFVCKGRQCAKEYSIRDTMSKLIAAARGYIYVEDQYFVNFYDVDLLVNALKHVQYLIVVTNDARPATSKGPEDDHGHDMDFPWGMYRRRSVVNSLFRAPEAKGKVHVYFRRTMGVDPTQAKHSYIHAKTWIVDDEVAVIGSANFDRRGWGLQTEVGVAICDSPASVFQPSFAQRLRMRLWSEHLGERPEQLKGWLPSVQRYWLKVRAGARIVEYDVDADPETDGYPEMMRKMQMSVPQSPVAPAAPALAKWFADADVSDPPPLTQPCRCDPLDMECK